MTNISVFRSTMKLVRTVGFAAALVSAAAASIAMAVDSDSVWTFVRLFGASVFVTILGSLTEPGERRGLPQHRYDGINPATGLPFDSRRGLDTSGRPWGGFPEGGRR